MIGLKGIICSVLLGCCLNNIAQDVNFNWAKGDQGTVGILSAISDISGNIYTTGTFDSIIDADPGNGVFQLFGDSTSFINRTRQFFVQKLDSNGNFIWAKSIGGVHGDEEVTSIAIDQNENVYLTGSFSGVSDFDPDTSVYTLVAQTPSRNVDNTFILKLNTNGNFLWAKSLKGRLSNTGRTIYVGKNNGVFISGTFADTVDFNPDTAMTHLKVSPPSRPNYYNSTSYLLKLDPQGAFVWVKTIDGVEGNHIISCKLDGQGNIYSFGRFEGITDFDPDTSSFILNSSNNDFIQKLDSNGNFIWAVTPKSGGGGGYAMEVDPLGNIYITGCLSGTSDFNPDPNQTFNLTSNGNCDIVIQRLNAHGNFVWASSFGSIISDLGRRIAIDKEYNVYVGGTFGRTIDFDNGPGVTNLSASGFGSDEFLLKLDSSGLFRWVKGIIHRSSGVVLTSIKTDVRNNLYLQGAFSGTIDFDLEQTVFNMTAPKSFTPFLTKSSTVNRILGVDILKSEHVNFRVAPNPSSDLIYAFVNSTESFDLQCFDLNGKLIFEKFNLKNGDLIELNQPAGIYQLKLVTPQKIYFTKLITQ